MKKIKLTVKEILNLTSEELKEMMTSEQVDRMFEILKDNAESNKFSAFLTYFQDGAKESGLNENEEYCSIDEYLEYLEEM